MVVPKLRFREFEGEWGQKFLGEITSKVGSGSTPKGGVEVYQESGIPFIRSQNVYDNKLFVDETHISNDLHAQMRGSTVLPNDILLNITGGSIGRSCVVPDDFKEGNVNQHVCIIRVKSEYSPLFLQSFLFSYKGQKLIYQGQTGSGREGINFQSIRLFKLFFPTLPEQQKIAGFLGAVDQKIQQLTQKKALLEEYKKGVMQQIFSQQIRFKREDGKDFPDWEEKRLGDLVLSHKSGASLKPSDFRAFSDFEVIPKKAIGAGGNLILNTRVPTFCSEAFYFTNESSVIDKSYLITTLRDLVPSGPSIGFIVQYNSNVQYILAQGVYALLIDEKRLNREWIIQFSNTVEFRRVMQTIMVGSTQVHIRNHDYFKTKLALPSLEEQQKIATFLSGIDSKIEGVENQLTQTQTFKKGLLQQMFV